MLSTVEKSIKMAATESKKMCCLIKAHPLQSLYSRTEYIFSLRQKKLWKYSLRGSVATSKEAKPVFQNQLIQSALQIADLKVNHLLTLNSSCCAHRNVWHLNELLCSAWLKWHCFETPAQSSDYSSWKHLWNVKNTCDLTEVKGTPFRNFFSEIIEKKSNWK